MTRDDPQVIAFIEAIRQGDTAAPTILCDFLWEHGNDDGQGEWQLGGSWERSVLGLYALPGSPGNAVCPMCKGTGDQGRNRHERQWTRCDGCDGSGEVAYGPAADDSLRPFLVEWLKRTEPDRNVLPNESANYTRWQMVDSLAVSWVPPTWLISQHTPTRSYWAIGEDGFDSQVSARIALKRRVLALFPEAEVVCAAEITARRILRMAHGYISHEFYDADLKAVGLRIDPQRGWVGKVDIRPCKGEPAPAMVRLGEDADAIPCVPIRCTVTQTIHVSLLIPPEPAQEARARNVATNEGDTPGTVTVDGVTYTVPPRTTMEIPP